MRSSRLYSQNEVQNQNKETDATTKPIKETQSTTTDVDPTEEVKTGIVVDDEKIPGAVKVFSALGMVPFIAGAVGPFVLPMEYVLGRMRVFEVSLTFCYWSFIELPDKLYSSK
jgi:hypothetical protein